MARAKAQKFQLPALDTGPLSLLGIREQARRQLLDLIDSRRGRKALILDASISGPLSLLDSNLLDVLTEHGVIKMLHLEPKRLDDMQYNAAEPKLTGTKTIVYIVRATVQNAQTIAAQVRGARNNAQEPHEFSVFFVPRRTIACERVLEEEGVYGDLMLGEFGLELLPVEDDVLSLELDGAFKECVVDGDSTSLFYVARAVMRLQHLFGLIPRMQGKGYAAAAVRDMCIRIRQENPQQTPTLASGTPRISRAIFLDREVDLLTPMMTQITFEGLIDEVTGIKYGAVQIKDKAGGDGSDFASRGGVASTSAAGPAAPTRGLTVLLNSTDPFYREFRDLPYYITTQRLQQYAKDAKREYAEIASKDISELSAFVKGIPKLSLLERLSDIAAPVSEQVRQQLFHSKLRVEQDIVEHHEMDACVAFIEELMYRGADVVEVLRLMVLLSACHNGVPRRHLDSLRHELLHTYGHQHLLTLDALETSGIIKFAPPGKSGFSSMRKALRLTVPEEEKPQAPPASPGGGQQHKPPLAPSLPPTAAGSSQPTPTDVSYLYRGYAPLSIRLVELALSTGWASQHDALELLPGKYFDLQQATDENDMPTKRAYRHVNNNVNSAAAAAHGAAGGALGAVHVPAGNNVGAAAASAPAGAGGASTSGTAAAAAAPSHRTSQTGSSDGAAAAAAAAASGAWLGGGTPGGAAAPPELVLVVFIGGVTFAEISALRFLASRPDSRHQFLVLTTKIINGRTLLQPFIDPVAARTGSCVGIQ